MVGIAAALVLIFGPLLLGWAGWLRARREAAGTAARGDWRLTASSMLLYCLAFNVTFFLQELFLVLPKAPLPGVRATLYHNSHHWEGDNPLTSLFQGTGALATTLCGLACLLLVRSRRQRSQSVQLFLIWMAYNGLLMALPQVVLPALTSGSDLDMAMDYLHFGTAGKRVAALLALALIPLAALAVARPLLRLAGNSTELASVRARSRWVFQAATLPALMAVPLIIAFRVPREWFEVVAPPVVVTLVGTAWIQAGAWSVRAVTPGPARSAGAIAYPLAAVLAALLIFQLLLRQGIRF